MRLYFVAASLGTVCLAGGLLSSAHAAVNLFDDVVIAKGQGVEVRRNQLDDAFVAFRANLAARGQNPTFGDGTLTVLESQMGGGMEMEQLSEA